MYNVESTTIVRMYNKDLKARMPNIFNAEKVQVGKDQEKAQSERDSGGKKPN